MCEQDKLMTQPAQQKKRRFRKQNKKNSTSQKIAVLCLPRRSWHQACFGHTQLNTFQLHLNIVSAKENDVPFLMFRCRKIWLHACHLWSSDWPPKYSSSFSSTVTDRKNATAKYVQSYCIYISLKSQNSSLCKTNRVQMKAMFLQILNIFSRKNAGNLSKAILLKYPNQYKKYDLFK